MSNNFSSTIQNMKNTVDNFAEKAVQSVNIETKKTFTELGNLVSEQNLNTLKNNVNQSVSGLNEGTTKMKTSVLEATGGAVNTITEATKQAASALKQTTEQATGVLNDATNIAVHRINDATSSITQTAEKTKIVLDETLQKTEQLSGAVAHNVQDIVVTSMKIWMSEHPIFSWIISHPLWAIILIVIMLFFCWNLLEVIAKFTQQTWSFILKAPLKFTHLILRSIFKRIDIFQLTTYEDDRDFQERLPEILNRLEALRQEQESLIREMRSILMSKN